VDEVPVGHVTNGVHMPTWDSAAADDLWTRACGKDRWLGNPENLEQDIRRVADDTIWQFRLATSKSLVEYARERLARHYAVAGASPETVEEAKHLFDPKALTLGFAGALRPTKDPICCCTTRNGCCACYPIRSARCKSSLRARRIRPTWRDKP
jgi:starch phosphorylase